MTTTARTRHTTNALTAGDLPRWTSLAVLIGATIVSTLIFGLQWLGSGDPLYVYTEKTEKLTLYPNVGGWLATIMVLYLFFIYLFSIVAENRRKALDRLITGLVTVAFIVAMLPLLSLIVTLIIKGLPGLNATFFLNDASIPGQRGAAHAILGTLLITLATSVISVPIGILTAIYLVEYGRGNAFSKAIGFFVDVMTGIPSIVAGLFAFALFTLVVQATGGDLTSVRSGAVGAVALIVLMLPTVVRSSEEMIRLVPHELREGAYALGVPKWRTILKVVLPTAIGGLVTSVLLAVARVIGETAPLLVAAGMSINMNTDLFSGVMSSLPTFVYQQWGFTTPEGNQLAWSGALILMLIVVILNAIGRLVSFFFSPKRDR